MGTPKVVTSKPEMGWISIDDKAWFTGNVLDPLASLSQVYVVHNDPRTGEQCQASPRSIRGHTIDSQAPLTISGAFVCDGDTQWRCPWTGSVVDGHWVVP